MSKFAKLLLIATSLSPLLGAVAVNQWATGDVNWWKWILATLVLIFSQPSHSLRTKLRKL